MVGHRRRVPSLDDLDDRFLHQVQVTPGERGAEQIEKALDLIRNDEGPLDRIVGLLEDGLSASPLAWGPLVDDALQLVGQLREERAAKGIHR